jgi:hypothetical protein
LPHLAQRRFALTVYLLASPGYDPVALLAGLLLSSFALGLALFASLVADLAGLVAGLVDLLPVLLEKLASLSSGILRLVYSLLDGLLALPDRVPDRRPHKPVEQTKQDQEDHDLPKDQTGVRQIEDTCRVKHVLSSSLAPLHPS